MTYDYRPRRDRREHQRRSLRVGGRLHPIRTLAAHYGPPGDKKFVGALHDRNARKGIFIATSGFSNGVVQYAQGLLLHVAPRRRTNAQRENSDRSPGAMGSASAAHRPNRRPVAVNKPLAKHRGIIWSAAFCRQRTVGRIGSQTLYQHRFDLPAEQ